MFCIWSFIHCYNATLAATYYAAAIYNKAASLAISLRADEWVCFDFNGVCFCFAFASSYECVEDDKDDYEEEDDYEEDNYN